MVILYRAVIKTEGKCEPKQGAPHHLCPANLPNHCTTHSSIATITLLALITAYTALPFRSNSFAADSVITEVISTPLATGGNADQDTERSG